MDRLVVSFLVGSAVFGALLFNELSDVAEPPAAVLPAAARTGASLPAPAAQRPRVEELVQTSLAQPLFSATRRPPNQPTAGRDSGPELPNIRLTGIVIEPDRRLAIFAVPGGKPLTREEGETINEWRLESIGPNQVSLNGPTGITTLTPKTDPNVARLKQIAPPVPKPTGPLAATPGTRGQQPKSPVVASPPIRPNSGSGHRPVPAPGPGPMLQQRNPTRPQ
jgi:general secretion pathway protein N